MSMYVIILMNITFIINQWSHEFVYNDVIEN